MRCEHNLYFLWDRFKHIGDSQFLEIVTTSKEIMSFHDHGAVVLRFVRSRNESSRNTGLSYLLVTRGLRFVTEGENLSTVFECISFNFFRHTSRDEHRTISGSVLSNFSSPFSNKT